LEIDGHFDLLEAVRQRQISAHHAGILVGYITRAPTKAAAGTDSCSKRRIFTEQAVLRGIVK
jgi:hypothetical protein